MRVLFHLHPGSKSFGASIDSIKTAKNMGLIENYPDSHPDPTQMTITTRLDQLEEAQTALKELEGQISSL